MKVATDPGSTQLNILIWSFHRVNRISSGDWIGCSLFKICVIVENWIGCEKMHRVFNKSLNLNQLFETFTNFLQIAQFWDSWKAFFYTSFRMLKIVKIRENIFSKISSSFKCNFHVDSSELWQNLWLDNL